MTSVKRGWAKAAKRMYVNVCQTWVDTTLYYGPNFNTYRDMVPSLNITTLLLGAYITIQYHALITWNWSRPGMELYLRGSSCKRQWEQVHCRWWDTWTCWDTPDTPFLWSQSFHSRAVPHSHQEIFSYLQTGVAALLGFRQHGLPFLAGDFNYPLVNIQKTMENHHLMGKAAISMAIFNSYVKLPEGKVFLFLVLWNWRWTPQICVSRKPERCWTPRLVERNSRKLIFHRPHLRGCNSWSVSCFLLPC